MGLLDGLLKLAVVGAAGYMAKQAIDDEREDAERRGENLGQYLGRKNSEFQEEVMAAYERGQRMSDSDLLEEWRITNSLARKTGYAKVLKERHGKE